MVSGWLDLCQDGTGRRGALALLCRLWIAHPTNSSDCRITGSDHLLGNIWTSGHDQCMEERRSVEDCVWLPIGSLLTPTVHRVMHHQDHRAACNGKEEERVMEKRE